MATWHSVNEFPPPYVNLVLVVESEDKWESAYILSPVSFDKHEGYYHYNTYIDTSRIHAWALLSEMLDDARQTP
jgi:hypothetical protein